MKNLKLCCEMSCGHVFEPDRGEGKCPKCGSQSIWLNTTVLGEWKNELIERMRSAERRGVKWEE